MNPACPLTNGGCDLSHTSRAATCPAALQSKDRTLQLTWQHGCPSLVTHHTKPANNLFVSASQTAESNRLTRLFALLFQKPGFFASDTALCSCEPVFARAFPRNTVTNHIKETKNAHSPPNCRPNPTRQAYLANSSQFVLQVLDGAVLGIQDVLENKSGFR